MSDPVLIAVIGCPRCKVDLFKVWGDPVPNFPAHRTNRLEKIGEHDSDHKTHAGCGVNLQRKPANGWA
ncbi:MAG: hypothetical protein ACRDRL_05345 [Sciscionella sp.]